MKIKDITGGYRAYRREVLEKLDLAAVESHGYCFQVDLAWRAIQEGFDVREVPITFTEREIGESEDRLDRTYLYPRATPEAALVHWFYLARSGTGPFREMDTQVDLSDGDLDCVYRLAKPFGLTESIEEWVRRAKGREDYDDNERWRDEFGPSGPSR